MDVGFEAHLRAGDVTVAERDVALLAAVDREGSLSAAADALGRSYSRAHKRIGAMESELGTLVERERGGASGGGSRLNEDGRALLTRFARVRAAFAGTAETEAAVLRGRVRDRDGELATVETPVGDVRALLFEDVSTVQVAVRADAVTLHDPVESPAADDSSARNRFTGTVAAVDRRESVALVSVTVRGDTAGNEESSTVPLPVLVTAESLDRLGLEPGRAIVATFKATATRATPV
jgi:molybdate transport system regulatory protein